jgi:hypothetical protein
MQSKHNAEMEFNFTNHRSIFWKEKSLFESLATVAIFTWSKAVNTNVTVPLGAQPTTAPYDFFGILGRRHIFRRFLPA